MITIAGISGSLRKHSFNPGLLRAAAEAVPDGCSLTIGTITGRPLYRADAENYDWATAVETVDDRRDHGEARWVGLGCIGDRVHVPIHTLRNQKIRLNQ